MTPAERHFEAAVRRRALLDRDRERGAPADVLAEHSRKLARLEDLWVRAKRSAVSQTADRVRNRRTAEARADRAVEMAAQAHRAIVAEEATPYTRRQLALAQAAGDAAQNHRQVTLIDRPVPGAPGVTRQVAVNRRVDTLAHERAQKRISHEEFWTGRAMQAIWEGQDGSRVAGADWTGGTRRSGLTDGLSTSERMAIRRIVDARRAEELNAEVREVIGHEGLTELRAVLCGHGYFADMAAAEGRSGERAASEIASRFRWLLRQATRALSGQSDKASQAVAPIRSWGAR